MAEAKHTQSWAEVAIDLYDKLTGQCGNYLMNLRTWKSGPSGVGKDAEHGHWKINGIREDPHT